MAAQINAVGNKPGFDGEPVLLTFLFGELAIPAAELASLDAGFVFPLRAPASRPVVILANGAKFAAGELIEVDGALAVRLCEGDGDGT
jgi:flagellar motor switch/type III secretory pathway protein FliN